MSAIQPQPRGPGLFEDYTPERIQDFLWERIRLKEPCTVDDLLEDTGFPDAMLDEHLGQLLHAGRVADAIGLSGAQYFYTKGAQA